MQWIKDLNLSIKIYLIVFLSLFMFLFTFVYALTAFNQNADDLIKLETQIYPQVEISSMNTILLTRTDELYTQAVTFFDEDTVATANDTYIVLKNNIEALIDLDSGNLDELSELLDTIANYNKISLNIVNGMLSETIDYATLPTLAAEKLQYYESATSALENYKTKVEALFQSAIEDSQTRGRSVIKNSLIFGLTLSIILLLSAVTLARTVTSTINRVRISLDELADGKGDLHKRINVQNNDEIGKVASNFNRFMDTLIEAIQGVVAATAPLKHTAERLIETSNHSKEFAAHQSQSSKSAQTSMNEFSHSIQAIAASATEANKEGQEAETVSSSAREVVQETISISQEFSVKIHEAADSVNNMATKTDDVGTILNVIATISEQTNLLALNAAIEAARAGEQGRGFAVVADEVRTLATKTADATKEISAVLEGLRSSAKANVSLMEHAMNISDKNEDLAKKAGEALDRIKEKIDSMAALNAKVATATEEQTSSVLRVTTLIDDMADSAQKNNDALLVLDGIAQEIGAASASLTRASSKFRL